MTSAPLTIGSNTCTVHIGLLRHSTMRKLFAVTAVASVPVLAFGRMRHAKYRQRGPLQANRRQYKRNRKRKVRQQVLFLKKLDLFRIWR